MRIRTIPVREPDQDESATPDGTHAEEELFISAGSWAGAHLVPVEWDQSYLDLLAAHVRATAVAGSKADR